jgi:acyl-CoA synthetase (AMP-forming)/AMP-acid ligase II
MAFPGSGNFVSDKILTKKDGIRTTVWDKWVDNSHNHPYREAVVHWVAGEEPFRWTWKELFLTASSLSLRLADHGIRNGDVCALIIRHNRFFYPLYLAVSSLGALPAILAYPNPRLHPEKFRQGLEGMAQRSGLDWVLTERELDEMIRPLLTKSGSTIRGVFFPLEWVEMPIPSTGLISRKETAPTSPCLLQHSSGTTGLQKAVVLSHRAVLEHVYRYGGAIKASPEDRIVSWLPLYHDMGLIAAFYLPLVLGIPLVQLDPFEWVVAPVTLLEALSREKGTLTWLPNFGYNLMADRIREEDLEGIRLDNLRMVINCSEPVRWESHERFRRRFTKYGFRRESLAACYAMAETTFAVTQTPPGVEAKKISISRQDISKGNAKLAMKGEIIRECVSSGFPISGCELRILDDKGMDLHLGSIGEIAIRSVSLFDEYRNNKEKTDEVLKDGWYLSGDCGFLHEEELYVIGRKKEIIIVAGNNIYPEDVEDAVGKVEGVLPGRVIAFGLEDEETGTEQICVIAETPHGEEQACRKLRRAIVITCMDIDVTVSRVYLAPPRWLIKSSAGKPSRNANRDRAIQELLYR